MIANYYMFTLGTHNFMFRDNRYLLTVQIWPGNTFFFQTVTSKNNSISGSFRYEN